MDARTLVERGGSSRYFADRKITISPADVYAAADDAQRELCSECELIQKRIQIALVSGQEFYSYPSYTVASIAQATSSEAVLTIGTHVLQVGDMIHVSNVGNPCNGPQTISAIGTTSITLQGVTTIPSYTGTLGRVYHYLNSMVRPKGKRARILNSTGTASKIFRIGEQEVQDNAETFTQTGKPLYFYPILGSTPEIGVQPTPNDNYTLQFMVYRKPLPSETVSSTADPILDSDYDRALYTGTLYYVLSQFKREPGADLYIREAQINFEAAKQKAMEIRSKRVFVAGEASDYDDLRMP